MRDIDEDKFYECSDDDGEIIFNRFNNTVCGEYKIKQM